MREYEVSDEIQNMVSETQILYMVNNNLVNPDHLNALKYGGTFTDDAVASWLNLNVKTYRSYKKSAGPLKPDIQEHTLKLLSLIKHGIDVFGTAETFSEWLYTEHMFLDWKKPEAFLNTISGISYVDKRLSAIEYGDNS